MNWEISNKSESDLRSLARDIYDRLIFTSQQCNPNNVISVFMPMAFLYPTPPTPPTDGSTKSGKRKNILFEILDREKAEKDHKLEVNKYQKYIKDIGMIYEYHSKSLKMAINGSPIFPSCCVINKLDKQKLDIFYKKYSSMREEIDKKFNGS